MNAVFYIVFIEGKSLSVDKQKKMEKVNFSVSVFVVVLKNEIISENTFIYSIYAHAMMNIRFPS